MEAAWIALVGSCGSLTANNFPRFPMLYNNVLEFLLSSCTCLLCSKKKNFNHLLYSTTKFQFSSENLV